MIKCVKCKSMQVVKSGMHSYCEKCGFAKFDVDDDYVAKCCELVGMVLSNTAFQSYQDFEDVVDKTIEQHLPMLHNWLSTIVIGRSALDAQIRNCIRDHAINLHIGTTSYEEGGLVNPTNLNAISRLNNITKHKEVE